jgi:hypothetical protein
MKDFVILVFNVHKVRAEEVDEIAKKIEAECECKVYQLGHADKNCAPFYITCNLLGVTHDC